MVAPTTTSKPLAASIRPKQRKVVLATAPGLNTRSKPKVAAQVAAPPAHGTMAAKVKAVAGFPSTPFRAEVARKAHVQQLVVSKLKARQRNKSQALCVTRLKISPPSAGSHI